MPKVKVSIPGLIEGEIELEGITILMGSPMTGKTTLLRLIYDLTYAKKNSVIPLELFYIANEFLEKGTMEIALEDFKIECNKEETENPACRMSKSSIAYNAILFPSEMEYIIKYNYSPAYFESYNEFMNLINKLRAGTSGYYKIRIPDLIETEIASENYRLVEKIKKIDKKSISIDISSSTATKLGFIVKVVAEGLLPDPKSTILLFDDPQTNMHTEYQIKLAYILNKLAEIGYKILVTTHDLNFLTILACSNSIPEVMKLEEFKPQTKNLYIIDSSRQIQDYSLLSSSIPTYTDTLYKLYSECTKVK
ncbi:MAG: hypothetical protein RXR43_16740 [Sulfolobus sp.]